MAKRKYYVYIIKKQRQDKKRLEFNFWIDDLYKKEFQVEKDRFDYFSTPFETYEDAEKFIFDFVSEYEEREKEMFEELKRKYEKE